MRSRNGEYEYDSLRIPILPRMPTYSVEYRGSPGVVVHSACSRGGCSWSPSKSPYQNVSMSVRARRRREPLRPYVVGLSLFAVALGTLMFVIVGRPALPERLWQTLYGARVAAVIAQGCLP